MLLPGFDPRLSGLPAYLQTTWKVLIDGTALFRFPHSNVWDNKICHNSKSKPRINNSIYQNSSSFFLHAYIKIILQNHSKSSVEIIYLFIFFFIEIFFFLLSV